MHSSADQKGALNVIALKIKNWSSEDDARPNGLTKQAKGTGKRAKNITEDFEVRNQQLMRAVLKFFKLNYL